MVSSYNNFLNEDLLNRIEEYYEKMRYNYAWKMVHNGEYCKIIADGCNGSIMGLPLIPFADEIYDNYIRVNPKLKDISSGCNPFYYIWERGSHLGWHNDEGWAFGSSIWLNKKWDRNDGGLFMYENNENDIKVILPTYNKMSLNLDNTFHAVSMISNQSHKIRRSIQVWGLYKDQNKKMREWE